MRGLSGPIPGENFTSDVKNYPWHRPPEHTDLDKAIEASAKKLLSPDGAPGIVTLLKMGMDIATITDMFVTSGIGAGKWTPDFALLMVGPISHIIYLMAEGYGIEPKLGIERPKQKMTASVLNTIATDNKKVETVKKALADMAPEMQSQVKAVTTGFMGMKSPSDEASTGGM